MVFDNKRIDKILIDMQSDLMQFMQDADISSPVVVGIHSGGVLVARRLHAAMDLEEEMGELNSGFYRDDFSSHGLKAQLKPSVMPLSVEGRHIILVDDVLYSGRTVRGAMNELFDYGRPASITLAVRTLLVHASLLS